MDEASWIVMKDIFLKLKDPRISDENLRKLCSFDLFNDFGRHDLFIPVSVSISQLVEVNPNDLSSYLP